MSIDDVPNEVLSIILSEIDWDLLIPLKRVCKRWKSVIESPYTKKVLEFDELDRSFKRRCIKRIKSKVIHPCFCLHSQLGIEYGFYEMIRISWMMRCIDLFSSKYDIKFSKERVESIVDDISLVCFHEYKNTAELIIEFEGYKKKIGWDKNDVHKLYYGSLGFPKSWLSKPTEFIIQRFKGNVFWWTNISRNEGRKGYHIFQYIWYNICPDLCKFE